MIKILKNNYELLLLTIIALVIRLINLGKLNLWLDEGVTAQTIHSGLSYIIRDSFTAEPTPPLYNSLMYFWVQLFGDSEFALRFPSACFGALSISLVYLIGKKYVSKEVGVLSAFLLIGNPFYLYYSQEARSYTLFSFFALLSVYYFPIGLEWKDKKNYLIATLLVPWVHAYGVFLILAQNIYVLIKYRPEKKIFLKTWLKYQAFIILVSSSWYVYFIINNKKYLKRFMWIRPVTVKDIFELLKISIGKGEFIVEILFVISFLTAAILKKRQNNKHDLLLFLLWPLCTIIVPIIVGNIWHPFFIDRYAIAASMVVGLFVLAPMDLFFKQSIKVFISILFLVIIFNIYQISNYFQSTKKDEWTNVLDTILKDDQKKVIVILENYNEESSMDYYLRKMNLKDRIQPYYLKDLNQAKFLIKNHDYAWLIYSEALSPKGFNVDQYFTEEKFSQPDHYLQVVKLKVRSQGVL